MKVFFLLLLLVSFVIPGFVFAQSANLRTDDLPGASDLFDTLDNLFAWLFRIGAVVFTFMILFGGYSFLTAGGDPNKVVQGRKIVIWAVIGFVIISIAAVSDDIVRSIIGV